MFRLPEVVFWEVDSSGTVSIMAGGKGRSRRRQSTETKLALLVLSKMTENADVLYGLTILTVAVILALGLACRLDAQVIERVVTVIVMGARR